MFGWSATDRQRAEDLLYLGTTSVYAEPWRVITSTLMHRLAPHFGFNLFTLWWFGREVEGRYGPWIFTLIFVGSLWTGQLATLSVGLLPLHGVSGAVCGLYGFLLVADWRGRLLITLRHRPAYWLYPLALLTLFVASWLGLIAVANFNHVTAIAYGALVGLATKQIESRAWWWSALAAVTTVATVAGAYRFERPWRGLPALTTIGCESARHPTGDVTKQPFVRVLLVDPAVRAKTIYYIDTDGTKVRLSQNRSRTYRLFPYVSTVWRIEESDGGCRAQFEVERAGVVTLD